MDTIIISVTNDRMAVASGRFLAGDTCLVQVRGLPEGTDAAAIRFAILSPERSPVAACAEFGEDFSGELSLATEEMAAAIAQIPSGRPSLFAFALFTEAGNVLAAGFATVVSLPMPADYDPLPETLHYIDNSELQEAISNAVNGLAEVARTGSYNDLTDKPPSPLAGQTLGTGLTQRELEIALLKVWRVLGGSVDISSLAAMQVVVGTAGLEAGTLQDLGNAVQAGMGDVGTNTVADLEAALDALGTPAAQ